MTTPDYSDVRSRHRREIRDEEWPRHESDRRILVLGFCSVMAVVVVVVTAVAVMWP